MAGFPTIRTLCWTTSCSRRCSGLVLGSASSQPRAVTLGATSSVSMQPSTTMIASRQAWSSSGEINVICDRMCSRRTSSTSAAGTQPICSRSGGSTDSNQILREAYEAGTLLCGLSAGAACWLESCLTDSFGSLAPLKDGLGFLQGSLCPHYDSEGERRPAYRTAVAVGALPAGWAIDDGAAALFTDEQLTEVVARVPGATVHHVTQADGTAVEMSLPARLLTSHRNA